MMMRCRAVGAEIHKRGGEREAARGVQKNNVWVRRGRGEKRKGGGGKRCGKRGKGEKEDIRRGARESHREKESRTPRRQEVGCEVKSKGGTTTVARGAKCARHVHVRPGAKRAKWGDFVLGGCVVWGVFLGGTGAADAVIGVLCVLYCVVMKSGKKRGEGWRAPRRRARCKVLLPLCPPLLLPLLHAHAPLSVRTPQLREGALKRGARAAAARAVSEREREREVVVQISARAQAKVARPTVANHTRIKNQTCHSSWGRGSEEGGREPLSPSARAHTPRKTN